LLVRAGDGQAERSERRERHAQRAAVARVLPAPGRGALLRTPAGDVVVYDESADKRRPVELRAIVMPDGETVEFQTARFRRGR
jgi:hypothetical protein